MDQNHDDAVQAILGRRACWARCLSSCVVLLRWVLLPDVRIHARQEVQAVICLGCELAITSGDIWAIIDVCEGCQERHIVGFVHEGPCFAMRVRSVPPKVAQRVRAGWLGMN